MCDVIKVVNIIIVFCKFLNVLIVFPTKVQVKSIKQFLRDFLGGVGSGSMIWTHGQLWVGSFDL